MRATARHSAEQPDYYNYEDSDLFRWQLTPGERVCPPPYRPSRKARLLKLLLSLLALGAGWVAFRDRVDWHQLPDQMAFLLTSLLEEPLSQPEPQVEAAEPPADTAAVETTPQTEQTEQSVELAAVAPDQPATDEGATTEDPSAQENEGLEKAAEPITSINSVPESEKTEEEEGQAKKVSERPVEPLPPPEPDPSDPYQMRAAAVGLHPGLSRVLLERLTPADYRNAEIAIKTALAKTPNGGQYVWPRQRRPDLALFKVHFVKGAAPGCRRYVVTIIKDGWSTTALPMENCEARGPRPERRVSSLPHR